MTITSIKSQGIDNSVWYFQTALDILNNAFKYVLFYDTKWTQIYSCTCMDEKIQLHL